MAYTFSRNQSVVPVGLDGEYLHRFSHAVSDIFLSIENETCSFKACKQKPVVVLFEEVVRQGERKISSRHQCRPRCAKHARSYIERHKVEIELDDHVSMKSLSITMSAMVDVVREVETHWPDTLKTRKQFDPDMKVISRDAYEQLASNLELRIFTDGECLEFARRALVHPKYYMRDDYGLVAAELLGTLRGRCL